MEPSEKLDVPQGTLELMILTILTREPLHGYGVSQKLAALSGDAFCVNPGSLFPLALSPGAGRQAQGRVGRQRQQPPGPSSTASRLPAGDSWIATASGGAA